MRPLWLLAAVFLGLETASTPLQVGALLVLAPPTQAQRRSFYRRIGPLIGARLIVQSFTDASLRRSGRRSYRSPFLSARTPSTTRIVIATLRHQLAEFARLSTATRDLIVDAGETLNTTVYSCDGHLYFEPSVCRRALPDVRSLADGILAAIRGLHRGETPVRRSHKLRGMQQG